MNILATLNDIEMEKLSVCSCGRNEPALYFCDRYPNICKRKITQGEGKEPILEE